MRMHWVKPTYTDPGATVFGELVLRRDSRIDSDLMSEIFAPAGEKESKSFAPKAQKAPGITVLNATRAHNLAIMLSRLRISTRDACEAISETRFEETQLGIEDLETIAAAMPTTDESKKLEGYMNAPGKLRDVEQKVLPLCSLSKGRLRVMKTAVSFKTTNTFLKQRIQFVHGAASGLRGSEQFRELLGVTLQIGNFVNHGITEKDTHAGGVKGFAIESLHTLSTFKKGSISALHFLCLTLMQTSDDSFLNSLLQSLGSTRDAKREHLPTLKRDVQSFQQDVEFSIKFLQQLPPEDPGKERLMNLSSQLGDAAADLKSELDSAIQLCTETLSYFSVSSEDPDKSFQPFCSNICQFLRQFESAWKQIEDGRGHCAKLSKGRKKTMKNAQSMPKQHQKSVPRTTGKHTLETALRHTSKLQIRAGSKKKTNWCSTRTLRMLRPCCKTVKWKDLRQPENFQDAQPTPRISKSESATTWQRTRSLPPLPPDADQSETDEDLKLVEQDRSYKSWARIQTCDLNTMVDCEDLSDSENEENANESINLVKG